MLKTSFNGCFFIPQLEKARQATDAANLRAAYAEAATERVSNEDSDGDGTIGSVTSLPMTQENGNFDKMSDSKIGNVALSTITVTKGNTVTVTVGEDGTPAFN